MNKIEKIGFFQATAMIFSGMVGSGILFLPSEMAHCGTWGIFSWILGTFMAYSIFLSFNSVNEYIVENVGNKIPSILDFLKLGYSEMIIFLLLFGHYLSMSFTCGVIALSLADYSIGLFHFCFNRQLIAMIALLLVFVINTLSFKTANSINFWLSLLKFVFFLLISVLSIKYFSHYSPSFLNYSLLFDGASISMFAFLGIEFGIFAAHSIENPKINVLKATKLGLVLAAIIFLGIFISCLVVLPNLSQTKTPVYDCAIKLLGSFGGKFVGLIAIFSCLTGLNSRLLIQGNSLRNFSQRQFVPKVFKVQTKQGFPWIGSLFSQILSSLVIFLADRIDLTIFIVILVAFLYTSIVILDIKLNGISLSSLVALISCGIMFFNANIVVIFAIILTYVLGFILKIINQRILSRG